MRLEDRPKGRSFIMGGGSFGISFYYLYAPFKAPSDEGAPRSGGGEICLLSYFSLPPALRAFCPFCPLRGHFPRFRGNQPSSEGGFG